MQKLVKLQNSPKQQTPCKVCDEAFALNHSNFTCHYNLYPISYILYPILSYILSYPIHIYPILIMMRGGFAFQPSNNTLCKHRQTQPTKLTLSPHLTPPPHLQPTMTAMGESRTELLAWLNDLLQLGYTKIEQCGTGAAHCQIMDSIFKDVCTLLLVLSFSLLRHGGFDCLVLLSYHLLYVYTYISCNNNNTLLHTRTYADPPLPPVGPPRTCKIQRKTRIRIRCKL